MRPWTAALVALLVLPLAGCSEEADTTSEVEAWSVVGGSAVAAVDGTTSVVMLPSGRAELTVTEPRTTVDARQTRPLVDLRAARGTRLVGLSWGLDRSAYRENINYDVLRWREVVGEPEPVRLTLLADDRVVPVPGVGTLAEPGERRLSTVVWVAVPAGAALSARVDYDGLAQTVDLATGEVEAGPAAPLYEPIPVKQSPLCTESDSSSFSYQVCLVDAVVGLPYVRGAGWAAEGETWALVQVSDSDLGGPVEVTLDGKAPASAVRPDVGAPVQVFGVPADTGDLPIRVRWRNGDAPMRATLRAAAS